MDTAPATGSEEWGIVHNEDVKFVQRSEAAFGPVYDAGHYPTARQV
jgi:hypothetical protein